ncbi:PREDICTED: NADH dehydrogenase [ubiquinone] 1 alpha subcomplex subunit 7-like [Dinoponera quadriceps]|uniref:NADH dehydrogenase [ubiquinone] 1 alpha subcomplex subunit 7 n=1 Tax=Dinoponera quadriceps TaxID=609295 RepID=A0A6P3XSH8_DINQU|nr:PREDICTED: NADH dehydrogenase [ubiquinone] 1 alpha subcomplex subunit 7-like [Dinoponera quadriceps]
MPAPPVEHRSVTWILKLIRDIGRGRPIVLPHRYADDQSERTQPPPHIPGGPYHKTSQIYYYTHDARREVKPPLVISTTKQITAIESAPSTEKKYFTPGKNYRWD